MSVINIFQDKVLKFANYFMSRKHVHQLKSAYALLSAINTLTDNKVKLCHLYVNNSFPYHSIPVAINRCQDIVFQD
jgi:hypothetical protein